MLEGRPSGPPTHLHRRFKLFLCLSTPCHHSVPLPQPAQATWFQNVNCTEGARPLYFWLPFSSLGVLSSQPTILATSHEAKESRRCCVTQAPGRIFPTASILLTTGERNIPASYSPLACDGHPCSRNPHFLHPGPLSLITQP